MTTPRGKCRFLVFIALIGCLVAAYFGRGLYYRAMTIHQLLTENKHLKKAITNLTEEGQIGYAKIISQQVQDGQLLTTVKFVETARDDPTKIILEKEYTIKGDIVHFDALIVKFDDKMVMDGESRALYLWRRVYDEETAPQDGFAIEQPGTEPLRYSDLLELLPADQRQLFWSNIWDLAEEPDKLADQGIKAVYGNDVYMRLSTGFVYLFKINSAGQFYPEVVWDM
jgi:hypothetical protein